MIEQTSLAIIEEKNGLALMNAIMLWADATTQSSSSRRRDLLRDKKLAVAGFFRFTRKPPEQVTPIDVKNWQVEMESLKLKPATIYSRISRLSSFYQWLMADIELGKLIGNNPVGLARPKAPKSYQTEATKALSDDELRLLLGVIETKANGGDIVAKRDYVLLLLYLLTGIRRNELICLKGSDLEFNTERLIIRCKVKGGDYVAREVKEPLVVMALNSYLIDCKRTHVLSTSSPLWTRHDRAGAPGEALTSHAFAKNLKKYAKDAGIRNIHIHQIRHTYARIISEETGSILETQEALGHRNVATTRIYVQRIAVKRDKHSQQIKRRLDK
jgi:site-specific recombinase XerD